MATYSSPDRAGALEILRRSAEEQAAQAATSVDEVMRRAVEIAVNAIDAGLTNAGSDDMSPYRTARARLLADPAYVFEYRQDLVEASFDQELRKLHAGLSRSWRARELVDPTKVKALLGDRSTDRVDVTPDLVVAALHRVQVVAPFTGGIDAYSEVDPDFEPDPAPPLVTICYGLSTLVFHASHLIVAHGMRETSPGRSNPRSLRESPDEYARAVAELQSLIQWCESGALEPRSSTTAADHYGPIVYPVAAHALSFFVFHELGHLLVATGSPNEEELACDEFAAAILGSSDDDRCWLGAAMTGQLLSIVLRMSHTEWRSAEYPGASYRYSRIVEAMKREGAWLRPPVDYLLDIPSRVYEQEVFDTDTRRLVFFSYAAALLTRWGERVPPSSVLEAALAVLDYATSLPGVLDHPQLTCWNNESGQRAYVLTLEPYRALMVAGWILSGRAPQWEQLAAEAAVMLITTVNHDPPPTDGAAGLFLALGRHDARAGKRDRASFDYLARIGAIEPARSGFPRSTGVSVFYHSQSPGDGDIPVSGSPYAQTQLGAIMEAWRTYSSRTDRETPWYQQRGATALDQWPSR